MSIGFSIQSKFVDRRFAIVTKPRHRIDYRDEDGVFAALVDILERQRQFRFRFAHLQRGKEIKIASTERTNDQHLPATIRSGLRLFRMSCRR